MSCDVCIGSDNYDDRATFERTETPVARKVYRCGECREPIPVGTRYSKTVGKWDGDLLTLRQCLMCSEIQRVFSCGEGFTYGTLWDDMDEMAFPDLTTASECFKELSTPAKEFVLERWRKWKGIV